jgi:hypothetical protein
MTLTINSKTMTTLLPDNSGYLVSQAALGLMESTESEKRKE